MPTPSYLLKLSRAGHHLVDLDAMLVGVRQRREHGVIETATGQGGRRKFVYRLDMGEVVVPEDWPIVFGDFLFNVRSALDHLMVTIAPNNRKGSTEFRTYVKDPLETDENGQEVRPDDAARWRSTVKGFPKGFEEAFRSIQPFAEAEKYGQPAEDHALAILSSLQNADKHRWLVTVFQGVEKAEISIDDEPIFGMVAPIKDGIIVWEDRHPRTVSVVGSAVVGVGSRANQVREFGLLVEMLIRSVRAQILPALEPFL